MSEYQSKNALEITEKYLAKTIYELGGYKYFLFKNDILYSFSLYYKRIK